MACCPCAIQSGEGCANCSGPVLNNSMINSGTLWKLTISGISAGLANCCNNIGLTNPDCKSVNGSYIVPIAVGTSGDIFCLWCLSGGTDACGNLTDCFVDEFNDPPGFDVGLAFYSNFQSEFHDSSPTASVTVDTLAPAALQEGGHYGASGGFGGFNGLVNCFVGSTTTLFLESGGSFTSYASCCSWPNSMIIKRIA